MYDFGPPRGEEVAPGGGVWVSYSNLSESCCKLGWEILEPVGHNWQVMKNVFKP